jgi:AcrR family transcriptional regulator
VKISRREARKVERRAAIVDVARQSFFENGYAATTMSEIAAKLGGSKSTLWCYFPCKEDLFAAVLDDVTTQFRQQLNQAIELHEDLHSTLMRLCRHVVETLTEPHFICLHRLITAEGWRFPEVGRTLYERGPKNFRGIIAAYLDRCVQEGVMKPCDTMVAAGNLIALCTSGAHQKLVLNIIVKATPEDIQADTENAAETFLRAYGMDGAKRGRADIFTPHG